MISILFKYLFLFHKYFLLQETLTEVNVFA